MATPERLIIESMFMVADKEGRDVEFKLNAAQAKLDAHLTGRDIIPKARQEGISTYYLGRNTVKCMGKRNTRAVVISHDKESTQRMLHKVHYFIENIRGPKPVIKNSSKNEITFPKTNSMFYIGTAGSRKFGRGDTITDLHCSEIAYWPDPKGLMTGLLQAVPYSGEVSIESTGNGVGNYYHKMVMNALASKGRYRLHFFNWIDFPEYKVYLTPEQEVELLNNLDTELEEDMLVEKYNLTAGQLQWRREKLEELDYDLHEFKQEYPITLDECFQSSGRSIFQIVKSFDHDGWKKEDAYMHKLADHPKPGRAYSIGVDVGAGIGKDNSVIQVLDLESMEQVAIWVSNWIAPDTLAVHIDEVARMFNEAFVTVESNNHGLTTLVELTKLYPSIKIYRQDTVNRGDSVMTLGMRTSVRTKPMLLGKLRKLLTHDITIHDSGTTSELSTFVEKENGALEAEEGCKDDRVMALAMAAWAIEKAALIGLPPPLPKVEVKDPFSLDSIIEELQSRGTKFPISPQAAHD